MFEEVFKRYEYKYIIDTETYKRFLDAIKDKVSADPFGDDKGFYKITNLYFDTECNLFLDETIDKKQFRQKLRLRSYNKVDLNSDVFIEIKKKYKGVVSKRRTMLKLREAYDFLYANEWLSSYDDYNASNLQILREIEFFKNYYKLEPRVILSYDRQAFQGIYEEDLRITFDTNLQKRWTDLAIEKGPWGDVFFEKGSFILEVKVNDRIPLWLARTLSDLNCYKQSYSKYTYSFDKEQSELREIG